MDTFSVNGIKIDGDELNVDGVKITKQTLQSLKDWTEGSALPFYEIMVRLINDYVLKMDGDNEHSITMLKEMCYFNDLFKPIYDQAFKNNFAKKQ